MRNRSVLAVLVVALLAGLSPLAAETTIQRGIDVFATTANGTTYYDFAQSPIPAGFFCEGSKVFTGRVALKGLPLATGVPGQMGRTDTIIERLDDATFDANGVAVTRIQFRALSMVSIAPIKTACGSFYAYVSLAGKQRTTTMTIYRTEEGGGNFVAPLAVNARLTFIPVKPSRTKSARPLVLTGAFTFPTTSLPWSFQSNAKAKRIESVVVDTNGDLAPDTLLPGTSNFLPGRTPSRTKSFDGNCDPCPPYQCHTDPATQKEHCAYVLEPGCMIAICE
ncbi:MAG TPA: hypothetical protein VLX28_17540 [Thermoanaerobaculia bacterium]|nr:hypothetical protein [Thermoanaerobaculia bacterium]